jgi:hypothetical protein
MLRGSNEACARYLETTWIGHIPGIAIRRPFGHRSTSRFGHPLVLSPAVTALRDSLQIAVTASLARNLTPNMHPKVSGRLSNSCMSSVSSRGVEDRRSGWYALKTPTQNSVVSECQESRSVSTKFANRRTLHQASHSEIIC